MIKSNGWIKVLGACMVADGVLGLAFGPKYVRFWQIGPPDTAYRRMMDWLADRPPWSIRAAGAIEAGLGIVLLSKVGGGE